LDQFTWYFARLIADFTHPQSLPGTSCFLVNHNS
jgi:hypothetical protein